MRGTVVNTLVLAFALAGVSIALGQQTSAPPVKEKDVPKGKTPAGQSQLEQMLAQALKNNPDIRVASAKATMAEAELNRARLQVTQEVIRLHHALLSQRATVMYQTKKYERIKNLQATNAVSSEIVDEAQEALTAAKAKLAELDAQMEALLGKSAAAEANENAVRQHAVEALRRMQYVNEYSAAEALFRQVLEQRKPAGPMAERIRTALEKPVSVKVSDTFVHEILELLKKQTGIPNIRLVESLPEPKLSLELTELPLVAVLQYIEDSEPGWRFVVREYGILFAPEAKLPPGAVRVQEFLRKPAESRANAPNDYLMSGMPWTAPDNVEGTVTKVDSRGVITIKLTKSGSGLLAGHVLYVYRAGDKSSPPKHLGNVRIVNLQDQEAIAQPVGRLVEAPKPGDKVLSRFEPQPPVPSEKPPEDKRGAGEKQPPGGVEGQVVRIDAPGWVGIDLGVKDGVDTGDTVEVYRLGEKPTYLGTLVIGASKAKGAVGRPQGRLAAPIRVGDKVISRKPRPFAVFQSRAEEKSKD